MTRYNFNIDKIDNEINKLSKSSIEMQSQKDAINSKIESLGFIDMGLPSKTLWAKYNLGVNCNDLNEARKWFGGYYAWGEIEEKIGKPYDWKTYKYTKQAFENYVQVSKYCVKSSCGNEILYKNPDNKTQLDLEDDAAYMNSVDNDWPQTIPTVDQVKELVDNCTVRYIEEYKEIRDLNVIEFISNINDNQLIFPFAGKKFYYGYDIDEDFSAYWTSSLKTTNANMIAHKDCNWSYVLILSKFEFEKARTGNRSRQIGLPVRPVITL